MNLGDELLKIREQHGKLTPQVVVEEARSVDHPLHERFEWDDSAAGEAWRRQQAHELIRSVKAVYTEATDGREALVGRRFHAVQSEGPDSYVYEPTEVVIKNEFTAQLVLRNMEREWRQLYQRYQGFEEFLAMVKGDLAKAA